MTTIHQAETGESIPILPSKQESVHEAKQKEAGEPMPESLKHAFSFADAWSTENLATLEKIPPGKTFVLSRKEVNRLADEGKLSPKLMGMLENSKLTHSVAIINMGNGKFSFAGVRHRTKSAPDLTVEAQKKFLAEGGINKLNIMDSSGGPHMLNRQLKAVSPQHQEMFNRQRNAEEALVGAPHIALPIATGTALPEGSRDLGMRPLKGTIVEKMHTAEHALGIWTEDEVTAAGKDDDLVGTLKNPIPPERGIAVLSQISQGVGYMHEHGMVHRDLKVENLLFDAKGECHVTDFDTFQDFNRPMTLSKTDVTAPEGKVSYNEMSQLRQQGTPHLMAPWITGLMVSQPMNKATEASVPAKANLQKAVEENNLPEMRRINEEMYKPADCYNFAMMCYFMMVGKQPDYVQANAAKGSFMVYMATTKNNRDGTLFDPESTDNADEIKAKLSEAVNRGYPQELADLVFQGLSSNPAEVPTMAQFQAVLNKHKMNTPDR